MTNKQIADEYYKKLMKDISDLGEYDPFCPVIKEYIHEIVKQERLKAIEEKIEIYKNVTDDSMIDDLYIDEIRELEKQKEQFEK